MRQIRGGENERLAEKVVRKICLITPTISGDLIIACVFRKRGQKLEISSRTNNVPKVNTRSGIKDHWWKILQVHCDVNEA